MDYPLTKRPRSAIIEWNTGLLFLLRRGTLFHGAEKTLFCKDSHHAIFIVMAMSGPLGVLLFILKAIDERPRKRSRPPAGECLYPTRACLHPKEEPVHGPDMPTRSRKRQAMAQEHCHLCTIHGRCLLFAGVMDVVDVIGAWQLMPDPGELFSDIVMAIGGGGALLTGLRMNSTRKLERLLDNVVGERDNISLPELFAAAGWMPPGDVLP